MQGVSIVAMEKTNIVRRHIPECVHEEYMAEALCKKHPGRRAMSRFGAIGESTEVSTIRAQSQPSNLRQFSSLPLFLGIIFRFFVSKVSPGTNMQR